MNGPVLDAQVEKKMYDSPLISFLLPICISYNLQCSEWSSYSSSEEKSLIRLSFLFYFTPIANPLAGFCWGRDEVLYRQKIAFHHFFSSRSTAFGILISASTLVPTAIHFSDDFLKLDYITLPPFTFQ